MQRYQLRLALVELAVVSGLQRQPRVSLVDLVGGQGGGGGPKAGVGGGGRRWGVEVRVGVGVRGKGRAREG